MKWWIASIFAVGCFLVWGAAAAEHRESIVPGAIETLAGAGLKIRSLRDFALVPLPNADMVLYTNQDTGEKIEAFAPAQLWRNGQMEGLLKGNAGAIAVATVQFNLLAELTFRTMPGGQVQRSDFDQACAANAPAAWPPDALQLWVETFTGNLIESQVVKVEGFAAPYPFVRYRFKGFDAYRQGWLLAIPRAEGKQYVFLLFEFAATVDSRDVERAVLSCIKSLSAVQPAGAPKKADVKLQNKKVMRGVDTDNPELKAARERVIQNIRNLKDWWFVETPNYVITSNLAAANRRLVDMIQADIECLHDAYDKTIPPVKPITDVSVVRVFNTRENYLAYIPPDAKWSAGLWMPGKDELVISPIDVRQGADQARRRLLKVVYHEAFHQYLYYALNRTQPPVWFNEGHASLFGAANVDQRRMTVSLPEDEDLARILTEYLRKNKNLNLSEYLTMTYRQFYADGREENYAITWGLVYFFRKAAFLYPGRDYEKACPDTLRNLLAAGVNEEAQAIQAALNPLDVTRLQRDFYDFWGNTAKRGRAERNDPFKIAR